MTLSVFNLDGCMCRNLAMTCKYNFAGKLHFAASIYERMLSFRVPTSIQTYNTMIRYRVFLALFWVLWPERNNCICERERKET